MLDWSRIMSQINHLVAASVLRCLLNHEPCLLEPACLTLLRCCVLLMQVHISAMMREQDVIQAYIESTTPPSESNASSEPRPQGSSCGPASASGSHGAAAQQAGPVHSVAADSSAGMPAAGGADKTGGCEGPITPWGSMQGLGVDASGSGASMNGAC